jgi:hypothetical protein
VRAAITKFFSSLVGDDLILNCYRLADRFKQNPDIFIDMPISRLQTHVRYTLKLIEAQEKARPRADDDDA